MQITSYINMSLNDYLPSTEQMLETHGTCQINKDVIVDAVNMTCIFSTASITQFNTLIWIPTQTQGAYHLHTSFVIKVYKSLLNCSQFWWHKDLFILGSEINNIACLHKAAKTVHFSGKVQKIVWKTI